MLPATALAARVPARDLRPRVGVARRGDASLSPLALVTRGWLTAGIAAALVGALAAWGASGRPRPPSTRRSLDALGSALRRPAVAVLAVAVGIGAAYTFALAFFTPVFEGDAHAYHLARAAFWKQAHEIGYIANALEPRLNVNPPNAEIGQLATMLLSESDRYVALPQLGAYLALTLAVVGLGRCAGLSVPRRCSAASPSRRYPSWSRRPRARSTTSWSPRSSQPRPTSRCDRAGLRSCSSPSRSASRWGRSSRRRSRSHARGRHCSRAAAPDWGSLLATLRRSRARLDWYSSTLPRPGARRRARRLRRSAGRDGAPGDHDRATAAPARPPRHVRRATSARSRLLGGRRLTRADRS